MKAKLTKDQQRKLLEQQARAIWDSWQSHLWYTWHDSEEGRAFHVKCCQDYAKQAFDLSKLF